MTPQELHITSMATVVVAVSDQERALRFYADVLGFTPGPDFRYPTGEWWLEVSPPQGGTRLTLAAGGPAELVGRETGVILSSSDVEGDLAELRRRGVDTDEQPLPVGVVTWWAGAPLAGRPPQFRFRDPDGNELLLVSDH